MLAKLIGYGADRAQAISRLRRGLDEYLLSGIKTNILLFRQILGEQDFQVGEIDTGYLDRLLQTDAAARNDKQADIAAIAAGIFAALDSASPARNGTAGEAPEARPSPASTWKRTASTDALRQ